MPADDDIMAADGRLLDELTSIVSAAAAAIVAACAGSLDTRTKADLTPVTAADHAAEAVILEGLARLLPGMCVVSEEAAGRALPARIPDSFVLVDPLDGTRELVAGREEFTINLAIVDGERPRLGIVAAPAQGLLWRGIEGRGAERLRLSPGAPANAAQARSVVRTRPAPRAGLVAAVSRSHLDPQTEALLARLPIADRYVWTRRLRCGSASESATRGHLARRPGLPPALARAKKLSRPPPEGHSLAGPAAIRLRFGRKAKVSSWVAVNSTPDSMEQSMRAMTRTIALTFVLLGLASASVLAQANPPPPSNAPGPQPQAPQSPSPPPPAPQYQGQQPQAQQYSSNEVIDAGHRFFGTISRGLAQIVEKAGSQFGLPNGYVLGQEAGGAVVAGLRYGEGILYTKNAGDLRVFWQGPSLGFDFGGEGARTMMLIYNLPATDAIYQRFAGIDGSAYFVGGLGMTALTMNNIVVVPIRTGVGMRLGANVGYLKFTPTATWNPF